MRDDILAAAATIANEWRALAAVWHLIAGALLAALWSRRVDSSLIAGVVTLMAFSVATLAWWSGNPVNGTVFGAAGILMIVLAATPVPGPLTSISRGDLAAGMVMCAFGWLYPHFLTGPAWHYVYAAPLGLLPCPTLAFIIGTALLTDSFGLRAWGLLAGSLGLLYGLIGVFVLGVTIDWVLTAGAAMLLARTVAPLHLLDAATIDREKRRV